MVDCGIEQFCSSSLLTTLTIKGVHVPSVFDILSHNKTDFFNANGNQIMKIAIIEKGHLMMYCSILD